MNSHSDAAHLARRSRVLFVGFALALLAIVLGAKWTTFEQYGSDIPNWDQWDAEGMELLVPWFKSDHFITHLFHPQNEHRVVITKLQNLTLTLLGGQWDARVQCATNAVVHSIIAVTCWCLACAWLKPARLKIEAGVPAIDHHGPIPWSKGAAFVLTVALFGLPLSWQNILSGFHSQQYWLIGLSLVTIVSLPWARPGTLSWWAASLAAALALLSMASGFFAALTVLAVLLLRALFSRLQPDPTDRSSSWQNALPTLSIALALVSIGFATRVEAPQHAALKAQSSHDFLLSLVRSMAWPVQDHDWTAVMLWSPWIFLGAEVLTAALFRRSIGLVKTAVDRKTALSLLGLGGWVFAQFVATAYARGAGAGYPASRYMDTVAFGAWINGIVVIWFLARSLRSTWQLRMLARGLASVWITALVVGLIALVGRNIRQEMPDTRTFYRDAEAHLRGYLATNDPAQLRFRNIPYPSSDALVQRLAYPELRSLLPVSVRPPLNLLAAANGPGTSQGVFLENEASQLSLDIAPHHGLPKTAPVVASIPTWGSFNQVGNATVGIWRSAPLDSALHGWLKIETAGDLGDSAAHVSLSLRDAQTDTLLATVQASRTPRNTWRAAYVKAPATPFILEARDTDPVHWFAFGAPTEMSKLSYLAWQCTKNGRLLLYAGVGATFLLAGLGLTSSFGKRRREICERTAENGTAGHDTGKLIV